MSIKRVEDSNEIRIVKDTKKKIKASIDYKKYQGYKFYKVNEDDQVDIVRIVSLYKDSPDVLVKREGESNSFKMDINDLAEKYTPLTPKGFITLNQVVIRDANGQNCPDVIVAMYDMIHVRMGERQPAAVCRQSINDFFYHLLMTDPNKTIAGVSVSQENCPANINYDVMMACDGVIRSDMVNFYLDDTIDTILDAVDTTPYDNVLHKLFKDHLASKGYGESSIKNFKYPSVDGWCRNVKALLVDNNFISDIDSMRHTTALNFDLKEFLVEVDKEVYEFNSVMLDFFNYIYKLNVTKTMVVPYGYDINLGEFNNSNYIFMRDSESVTWVVVYTSEGEYIEKDLVDEFNKLGVADKLRLSFYDKYHHE